MGTPLACNEDAERRLTEGEMVGVFPEGFKGIGKPFRERYTLQRFGRGGFVTAALRTGAPIIPCAIVGAEEIYPIDRKSTRLNSSHDNISYAVFCLKKKNNLIYKTQKNTSISHDNATIHT